LPAVCLNEIRVIAATDSQRSDFLVRRLISLDPQGPIGAADKAILIDLLPIMLAMLVMANLNGNTMPMDQLMQVLR
jgi:hypothetical protein